MIGRCTCKVIMWSGQLDKLIADSMKIRAAAT
eukprot:SAG31_NODE_1658_length_7616_cov_2.929227_5_plen_32_part_00